MLDQKNIENCLEFLNRTDLKGAEVPAFVDLVNRLHHLRNARIEEENATRATPPPAPPAPTTE